MSIFAIKCNQVDIYQQLLGDSINPSKATPRWIFKKSATTVTATHTIRGVISVFWLMKNIFKILVFCLKKALN